MGATAGRRYPIKQRRRVEDDGEDEEGSIVAAVEDDSMSEGSVITNADDDADAEGSDGSDAASSSKLPTQTQSLTNGHHKPTSTSLQQPTTDSGKPPLSAAIGDTEVMMNGLKMANEIEGTSVNFDDLAEQPEELLQPDSPQRGSAQPTNSLGEKRRQEHEEYKKKRDADPAFVPNRGGFFMHDHRSNAVGQNGFRPFGRGRAVTRPTRGGVTGQTGYVETMFCASYH